MLRRSGKKAVHRGRVVDLSEARLRRRGGGVPKAARAQRRRGGSPWRRVGLLAVLAICAVGVREGSDPLALRDWFAERAVPPLRAGINVDAGRADCRVARVIDGDTVDLMCPDQGAIRARLLGFDTPEIFSPGCPSELARGTAAAAALGRKISASREIRVALSGTDHYGRRLARLSLDGRDIAGPMIADGLARPYHGGTRRSWCG